MAEASLLSRPGSAAATVPGGNGSTSATSSPCRHVARAVEPSDRPAIATTDPVSAMRARVAIRARPARGRGINRRFQQGRQIELFSALEPLPGMASAPPTKAPTSVMITPYTLVTAATSSLLKPMST